MLPEAFVLRLQIPSPAFCATMKFATLKLVKPAAEARIVKLEDWEEFQPEELELVDSLMVRVLVPKSTPPVTLIRS